MGKTSHQSSIVAVVASLLEDVSSRSKGYDELTIYDGQKEPSISLKEYLGRWVQLSHCDDLVPVIAVIYIDRLCTRTGLEITRRNVHRLLLASLVVATKWHQERLHPNTYYAAVGGVSNAEISRLETNFINDIDWEAHIDPSTFNRYMRQFRHHRLWNTCTAQEKKPSHQAKAVPSPTHSIPEASPAGSASSASCSSRESSPGSTPKSSASRITPPQACRNAASRVAKAVRKTFASASITKGLTVSI